MSIDAVFDSIRVCLDSCCVVKRFSEEKKGSLSRNFVC